MDDFDDDDDKVMAAMDHHIFSPDFDYLQFDYVIEAKNNLRNNENIERTLSYLSTASLSLEMLDKSRIEKEIADCFDQMDRRFLPICAYILRKWRSQREGKESFSKRLLEPQKEAEQTDRKRKHQMDEFAFARAKKKRLYLGNHGGGVRSLKELCREKIRTRVLESVKRSSIAPLLSLVSRISSETMERLEESVPAIAEVSSRFWEAMLYRSFRGRTTSLSLAPKQAYLYLENRKRKFHVEIKKMLTLPPPALSLPGAGQLVQKEKPVSIRRLLRFVVCYLAHFFAS